ncbi:hypothetical protein ACS0TY_013625 [Phlomoides rotata]
MPIYQTDHLQIGCTEQDTREWTIMCRLRIAGRTRPPVSVVLVRRKPPDLEWYKVNIDGSSLLSPGQIFAGGIFRNNRGFFVAVFTKSIGWGFPLEAELAVGLLAIQYDHRHGWKHLWIKSNSILVVRALHSFQGSSS